MLRSNLKNEVIDERTHEFASLDILDGLNPSVSKLEVPNQTAVLKKYCLSCSMQKWIWLAGNWNIFHLQLFLEMQRWQLAAAFVFQTWVIISDMHQRSWECHNILTFLWFYLQTLISNLISMWYVCTFFQKSCSVPYQPPKSVAHLKVLAETLTFW